MSDDIQEIKKLLLGKVDPMYSTLDSLIKSVNLECSEPGLYQSSMNSVITFIETCFSTFKKEKKIDFYMVSRVFDKLDTLAISYRIKDQTFIYEAHFGLSSNELINYG